MKFRIVSEVNGFKSSFFIQKKVKVLWIFSYWKYVVDENVFPDNFYRTPKVFYSRDEARKYIKKLELPNVITITSI